jgi:hypothetical protein
MKINQLSKSFMSSMSSEGDNDFKNYLTIKPYYSKNQKVGKILKEFKIGFVGYETILDILIKTQDKCKISFQNYVLIYNGYLLESGLFLNSYKINSGDSIDMVLKYYKDEYEKDKINNELEEIEEEKETEEYEKEDNIMKKIKLRWNLDIKIDEDVKKVKEGYDKVEDDKVIEKEVESFYKKYYINRDELEKINKIRKVKKKLKILSQNQTEENNQFIKEIRESSIKTLRKCKTKILNEEDLKLIQNSIYHVKREINSSMGSNGMSLNVVIFSPFTPGNSISLFLQNHAYAGWSQSDFWGKIYYYKTTVEKNFKVRKIIQTKYNNKKDKYNKIFCSSQKLLNLQTFLFSDKIKVSPNRFFYFLLSCLGYDYLYSKINEFNDHDSLLLTEVKYYFRHDNESDDESKKE